MFRRCFRLIPKLCLLYQPTKLWIDNSLDEYYHTIMQSATSSPIMTVTQVSIMFGVKKTTVRSWAKQKTIPGFKVGKLWFFNRTLILKYLAEEK